MSKWFQYNQTLGKVELDETELLLIKEFRDLLDNNRNKSKTDPKGEHKERAFKELSYIYLAIDWNSHIIIMMNRIDMKQLLMIQG